MNGMMPGEQRKNHVSLRTRAMNREDAAAIAAWVYETPYDFYNMEQNEASVEELLNGQYRIVESVLGEVIGFYCAGDSAQVPAGHAAGVYDASRSVLDLGIGMQPSLTGRGFGRAFFAYVLKEMVGDPPSADVRLTVATFNRRAIHLYEQFGFQRELEFLANGTPFQTMRLRRGVVPA